MSAISLLLEKEVLHLLIGCLCKLIILFIYCFVPVFDSLEKPTILLVFWYCTSLELFPLYKLYYYFSTLLGLQNVNSHHFAAHELSLAYISCFKAQLNSLTSINLAD